MKITDALLGEHGPLGAQLRALEQTLPQLTSQPAVAASAALLSAALISHAELEDELLFQPLRDEGADGPWREMIEEHHHIAASLRAAETAASLDEARRHVLDAIRDAQEHFTKEEELLFPLVERQLIGDRSEALARRWGKARRVLLDGMDA